MKVAINRSYGGFHLSDKAIEMIMKRKGLECYRYKQTKYFFQDGKNEYKKIEPDDVRYGDELYLYYYTVDAGDVVEELPRDGHWFFNGLKRTDVDLIAVIEELGLDANSKIAKIKIVEIPDDINWEISEYDGMETVHETHRSWC